MSVLDGLNPEQKKAASQIEGPLLILAGAGSGKTRTLTYRIAHMIKEIGIAPWKILAVTFTNKAAKEMKERVRELIGEDGQDVVLSTFHSFGVRMLRMYGKNVGYDPNFNIYDNNDQKKIVSEIMKQKRIEVEGLTPAKVVSKISKLKEEGVFPEEYKQMAYIPYTKAVAEIYNDYQKKLKKNNSFDFADLLIYTNKLLEDKEVLEKIQNKFQYIMVDEYQDTNRIQYEIIHKIVAKTRNICVVGDEDQSIYGFRGADIRNILDFEKDYKEAVTIKLEQNYRSTETILETANNLISNNESSKGKRLWTDLGKGDRIAVYEAETEEDESAYVARKIKENIEKKGVKYKDFAILYRTNAQSRLLEDTFIKLNMPYKIFGGMQFYQRKEIKDIIAYLNVINNTSDELSLLRIINTPKRGLGNKAIEKLKEYQENMNVPLYYAIKHSNEISSLSKRAANSLQNLFKLLNDLQELSYNSTTSEIVNHLLTETKFIEHYETANQEDKVENINELKNSIFKMEQEDGFINLAEYLESAALVSNSKEEENDAINLMTIHSSKGLEFPIVFLVGMEDELFPGKKVMYNEDELEEERRLCYVGITRAQKNLFLTYSKSRVMFGEASYSREVSRFLGEMPEEHLDYPKYNAFSKGYKKNDIKNMADLKKKLDIIKKKKETVSGYQIGSYVNHKRFGEGKIKNIDKDKLLITFPGYGEKKFKISIAEKFLTKR